MNYYNQPINNQYNGGKSEEQGTHKCFHIIPTLLSAGTMLFFFCWYVNYASYNCWAEAYGYNGYEEALLNEPTRYEYQ